MYVYYNTRIPPTIYCNHIGRFGNHRMGSHTIIHNRPISCISPQRDWPQDISLGIVYTT